MAQPETPVLKVEEHRFPCEKCSADLRFDPGSKKLLCDFCGRAEALDCLAPQGKGEGDQDYHAALARSDGADQEITCVLNCEGCGAQIEYSSELHAKECPYCATPFLGQAGTHKHIKPHALVPFALTEDDAREAMQSWLGQTWFAPEGLGQYARKGRKLTGVYIPYWIYSARTETRYTAEQGSEYQTARNVARATLKNRMPVLQVRWRKMSGKIGRDFNDYPVIASQSLPTQTTDAMYPWHFSGLVPYSPKLVAGLRTEGYTVPLDEGIKAFGHYINRTVTKDVQVAVGGDQQHLHDIDTDIKDVTYQHILLPIWIAAYRYQGTVYRVIINGQTGKVIGERPVSRGKITFALMIGLLTYLWFVLPRINAAY